MRDHYARPWFSGSLAPLAHELDIRGRGPRRQDVVRPPARPLHALLHGDVGAVQLLRDAGPPDPVPGRIGAERRLRPDGQEGGGDLRPLHGGRLPDGAAGRVDRGPDLRAAARGLHRRLRDRRGPLQHGGADGAVVLSRPLPDRDRHGSPEAERQRDGRRPLPGGGRAPRFRLLVLLHGDQLRGLHRAFHLRLPRRAGQLALRVRRRRRRHGSRPHPVQARGAPSRNGRAAAAPGAGSRRPEDRHPGRPDRSRDSRGGARRRRHGERQSRNRGPGHGRRDRRDRPALLRLRPPFRRLDGRREEARRRDLPVLPGVVPLLGGLRAGRALRSTCLRRG